VEVLAVFLNRHVPAGKEIKNLNSSWIIVLAR